MHTAAASSLPAPLLALTGDASTVVVDDDGGGEAVRDVDEFGRDRVAQRALVRARRRYRNADNLYIRMTTRNLWRQLTCCRYYYSSFAYW